MEEFITVIDTSPYIVVGRMEKSPIRAFTALLWMNLEYLDYCSTLLMQEVGN